MFAKKMILAVKAQKMMLECKDLAEVEMLKEATEYLGVEVKTVLEAKEQGLNFYMQPADEEDGFSITLMITDPTKGAMVSTMKIVVLDEGDKTTVELLQGVEDNENGEDVYFPMN